MLPRIFCRNSILFYFIFILYGKAVLVVIRMVISGWLSIIVWCGAYGISGIVGVLKTWKVLCLISSCSFLEHYWIGYQPWRAFPFFYCWFIRFMQFCNWLFTPLYFLCTSVTCFPDLYNFITYQFLFLFLSVVFSSLINSDDLLVGISWIMSFWSSTHIGWHNYCFIFHLLES